MSDCSFEGSVCAMVVYWGVVGWVEGERWVQYIGVE
jgi:hypothetical protein